MLVCKTFTASVTSASSKAEVLARRSNFIEPGPSSLSTTERDQNFDQVSFFSAPEPIKNRIKFPFWSRWVRKKTKGINSGPMKSPTKQQKQLSCPSVSDCSWCLRKYYCKSISIDTIGRVGLELCSGRVRTSGRRQIARIFNPSNLKTLQKGRAFWECFVTLPT